MSNQARRLDTSIRSNLSTIPTYTHRLTNSARKGIPFLGKSSTHSLGLHHVITRSVHTTGGTSQFARIRIWLPIHAQKANTSQLVWICSFTSGGRSFPRTTVVVLMLSLPLDMNRFVHCFFSLLLTTDGAYVYLSPSLPTCANSHENPFPSLTRGFAFRKGGFWEGGNSFLLTHIWTVAGTKSSLAARLKNRWCSSKSYSYFFKNNTNCYFIYFKTLILKIFNVSSDKKLKQCVLFQLCPGMSWFFRQHVQ